jgi:hypothetical protein
MEATPMKLVGVISTAVLSLILGVAASAYAQEQREQQPEEKAKPAQQEKQNAQPAAKQQEKNAQQQDKNIRQEEKGAQQQQAKDNKQTEKNTQQQQKTARQEEQNAQQQQQKNAKQGQNNVQQQQKNLRQEQNNVQQQQQKNARQEQNNVQQQQKDARLEGKNVQQQRDNQRPQRTAEQQHIVQVSWQEHRSQHWDSDHRNWQQRGGYEGYRIPDERFQGYFGRDHAFRIYGLPFLVVGGYPRFQYDGFWFSMVDPWPDYWASDWYDTDDVYVLYVDNGYYLFNQRYPNVGIAVSISM